MGLKVSCSEAFETYPGIGSYLPTYPAIYMAVQAKRKFYSKTLAPWGRSIPFAECRSQRACR